MSDTQPIDEHTLLADILDVPRGHALLAGAFPGLINSPLLLQMRQISLGRVLEASSALHAGIDAEATAELLQRLAAISVESTPRIVPVVGPPRPDYQAADVPTGSATAMLPAVARVWNTVEVALEGPDHGNPFTDVELTAQVAAPSGARQRIGGFYDGDGTYRLRFLPDEAGRWSVSTASNARSLDGVHAEIVVDAATPEDHGPVRVADQHHFAYADGTRYIPVGTTAYAWTHQPRELQERTLATIAHSPFNKLRMCVFPKSYLFNSNEPPLYPFAGTAPESWDLTRFSPEYFRALEARIAQLGDLGVQSDLILFHAYDRWGFSTMDSGSDDRYVRYLVRRLSAMPSVWWSLANEYDLMWSKTVEDWERIARVIADNDPVRHLTSIHNCFGFYDHSRPWITHCSIQRIDVYRTAENTDEWRERWGKPVVIDECGYEGDIDQGWGNLTPRELVRRAWEGAVRGGYVAHGETYWNDREELWWSKGGELVGEAPARLGFLAELIDAAPNHAIDPLQGEWDLPWGGAGDEYRLAYFGFGQPAFRTVNAPEGRRYVVDVIDTWEMTIERLEGEFHGVFRVELPRRPYMALRMTAIQDE